MTTEKNALRLAAYSYLDEWLLTDQRLHLKLLAAIKGESVEAGADALREFAAQYRVSRTLKITNEVYRLADAYTALATVGDIDDENVVSKVCEYAATLREIYISTADSAATKLLWLRFRKPVVIYDSLAWRWITSRSNESEAKALRAREMTTFYPVFVGVWRREYERQRPDIEEACLDLLNIKRFTRAAEDSGEDLERCVASDWFLERVFDHYVIERSERIIS